MEIGVIGAGEMGTTLADLLSQRGHQLFIGSRSPERLGEIPGILFGSYAQAAESAEIILLVTAWEHTRDALEAAGDLTGKILIDCTNPESPEGGPHVLGHTTCGAELIASWATGARVVKAFNHIYGSMLRAGTHFGPDRAAIFYCGEDADAKAVVKSLAQDLDLDAIDAGGLIMARYLEPLAALWVALARQHPTGGENIGLKFLSR